jgi:glycosyltransferase involved in cell wall biosynthesis
MKICYDHQIFATQKHGGISRYFVELASRIHRQPGASVRIVAPVYRTRFLAEKADALPALPVVGVHYSGDLTWASGVIRRFDSALSHASAALYRPDIVHETYYSRKTTFSASAKTVVTVHDMIEELFPQYFPMSRGTSALRKAVFERVDHVICVSERTRADLLKLYDIGPEKISVVYHASSLSASMAKRAAVADKFFLYVGDRRGYKNFFGLLKAFGESLLYKTHMLVCFGGGQLTPSEQARMGQLGIPNDRVLCVGGNDALLAGYYAAATAFVYPSLYEGFGIPLLEAMACGCPVICSKSGSMPEVADKAAIYFDPTNACDIARAMLTVVESPFLRCDLISKGTARVGQFSWDVCAQQTYRVYQKLLSKESDKRRSEAVLTSATDYTA